MELLKVLDKNGKETGQILDKDIIHQKGLWHLEVAIWIFNSKGEILVQRRSLNKLMHPGKIGLCAGHVPSTEDPLTSAQRELFEEIGLKIDKKLIHFLITEKKEKIFNPNLINRIFNNVYYIIVDKPISNFTIQLDELSEIFLIDYLDFKQRILNNDEDFLIRIRPDNIQTFELLDQIYSKITNQ